MEACAPSDPLWVDAVGGTRLHAVAQIHFDPGHVAHASVVVGCFFRVQCKLSLVRPRSGPERAMRREPSIQTPLDRRLSHRHARFSGIQTLSFSVRSLRRSAETCTGRPSKNLSVCRPRTEVTLASTRLDGVLWSPMFCALFAAVGYTCLGVGAAVSVARAPSPSAIRRKRGPSRRRRHNRHASYRNLPILEIPHAAPGLPRQGAQVPLAMSAMGHSFVPRSQHWTHTQFLVHHCTVHTLHPCYCIRPCERESRCRLVLNPLLLFDTNAPSAGQYQNSPTVPSHLQSTAGDDA